MRRRVLPYARDAAAGAVSVGVLVGTTLVLGFNPVVGLGLAAATLVGGLLIVHPRTGEEIAEAETQEEVRRTLRGASGKVARMRSLAPLIPKKDIAAKVDRVCDRADNIVATLLANPTTLLSQAMRIDAMFGQTAGILEEYSELVTGKVHVPADQYTATTTKIEGDLLDLIESALKEFQEDLGREGVLNLETSIKVLERTLKLEGLS